MLSFRIGFFLHGLLVILVPSDVFCVLTFPLLVLQHRCSKVVRLAHRLRFICCFFVGIQLVQIRHVFVDLAATPLQVRLIVLLAILLDYVVHRLVVEVARDAANDRMPQLGLTEELVLLVRQSVLFLQVLQLRNFIDLEGGLPQVKFDPFNFLYYAFVLVKQVKQLIPCILLPEQGVLQLAHHDYTFHIFAFRLPQGHEGNTLLVGMILSRCLI